MITRDMMGIVELSSKSLETGLFDSYELVPAASNSTLLDGLSDITLLKDRSLPITPCHLLQSFTDIANIDKPFFESFMILYIVPCLPRRIQRFAIILVYRIRYIQPKLRPLRVW